MFDKKEIQKLINKLYKVVQKSGYSSHRFRDDDWSNLYSIRDIVQPYLPDGFRLLSFNIPQYSKDNMSKEYEFVVENAFSGEQIIRCLVTASACGSVSQPWRYYDLTCQWFPM